MTTMPLPSPAARSPTIRITQILLPQCYGHPLEALLPPLLAICET